MLSSMFAASAVTKWFLLNIWETTRASNFGVNRSVQAQRSEESLHIFTGNRVINYFRSTANRINVLILCYVRVTISQLQFNQFRKRLQFWKGQFKHFIAFSHTLDIFYTLTWKMGLNWTTPSSTHCTYGWFRLSRKITEDNKPQIYSSKHWNVCTCSWEMTSSAAVGRLQIAFMPPVNDFLVDH